MIPVNFMPPFFIQIKITSVAGRKTQLTSGMKCGYEGSGRIATRRPLPVPVGRNVQDPLHIG